MRLTPTLRLLLTAAIIVAGSVAAAAPAAADGVFQFQAGEACTFALRVDATGDLTGLVASGLPTAGRELTGGRGRALTFTNLGTGQSASASSDGAATVSLKATGSVLRTTTNPDGSVTVSTGGHNVIILFPGDVPAGPSTELYVGSLVYRVDTDGTYTVLKFSGKATDICALLS